MQIQEMYICPTHLIYSDSFIFLVRSSFANNKCFHHRTVVQIHIIATKIGTSKLLTDTLLV